MTENIYAMWKRRWPILKHMREDLLRAKQTIDATAILHNLAILWSDELPPLEPGEVAQQPGQNQNEDDDEDEEEEYVIVEDNAPR